MHNLRLRLISSIFFLIAAIPAFSQAKGEANVNKKVTDPMVAEQIYDKVHSNINWKLAFVTGKQGQVVFMNISPDTNPANEIGMETHKFDQIIFVVEGNGKAILNGKTTPLKAGDMIFIPIGTAHNVVNANKDKALKILSVYSGTDIPANVTYQKKSDEAKD